MSKRKTPPNRAAASMTIAEHVLATLPDSIPERLRLLEAMKELFPRDHDARTQLAIAILQLDAHDRALRDAQLTLGITS